MFSFSIPFILKYLLEMFTQMRFHSMNTNEHIQYSPKVILLQIKLLILNKMDSHIHRQHDTTHFHAIKYKKVFSIAFSLKYIKKGSSDGRRLI